MVRASVLTNRPTGTTNGGSALMISRACAGVTARGLPAWNTSPTACAPSRAAASASPTRVMPQIFTRVVMSIILPLSLYGPACQARNTQSRRRQPPASFVIDPRQVQAGSIEGRRRLRPVAALEHPRQPLSRLPALADADQAADDVAHHVVQERVGPKSENHV